MGQQLPSVARRPRGIGRRRTQLECWTRAGESPVSDTYRSRRLLFPSSTGHELSCANQGGPPPKANYMDSPIVHEYREGTVKSTPGGE